MLFLELYFWLFSCKVHEAGSGELTEGGCFGAASGGSVNEWQSSGSAYRGTSANYSQMASQSNRQYGSSSTAAAGHAYYGGSGNQTYNKWYWTAGTGRWLFRAGDLLKNWHDADTDSTTHLPLYGVWCMELLLWVFAVVSGVSATHIFVVKWLNVWQSF